MRASSFGVWPRAVLDGDTSHRLPTAAISDADAQPFKLALRLGGLLMVTVLDGAFQDDEPVDWRVGRVCFSFRRGVHLRLSIGPIASEEPCEGYLEVTFDFPEVIDGKGEENSGGNPKGCKVTFLRTPRTPPCLSHGFDRQGGAHARQPL